MSAENEDDLKLVHCTVTVNSSGDATARYRFDGLDVDGQESWDEEDVSDWTKDDIINLFADLIGIDRNGDCYNKIEVEWS